MTVPGTDARWRTRSRSRLPATNIVVVGGTALSNLAALVRALPGLTGGIPIGDRVNGQMAAGDAIPAVIC